MSNSGSSKSAARVRRRYDAQYLDPISVRAGDRVVVGREDPEYPGWRWCTAPDERAGWVPESFLQLEGVLGTMLRDYTARELTVSEGAAVVIGEAVSGWLWVTDAQGRAGWIPEICVSL